MPLKYFLGCFRRYATFSGRAGRPELWWYILFWFVLGLIAGNYARISGNFVPYYVYLLATLLPTAAVGTRRLHDTGRAGQLMWWVFLPFIGVIMLIVWCAGPGTFGPNRYGHAVGVSHASRIERDLVRPRRVRVKS